MAERDQAARGEQRAAARGDHGAGEAAAGGIRGPPGPAEGEGPGPGRAAAGGGLRALGVAAGGGQHGGDRGEQRAAARGDAGEAAAGGIHGRRGPAEGGVLGPGRAAAGGGRRAVDAAAGGGQRGDAPLGDGHKKTWMDGNQNKVVKERKIVRTTSPFKSENTPTKVRNKRLQDIIVELKDLKGLLTGEGTDEISKEALKHYRALLEEFDLVKEQIRRDNGMAIPMPKDLKKRPKFSVSLFQ